MKRRRLGRGQRTGYVLPGDPDAHGADQSRGPTRSTQPGLDQVGGRGLAGCARHSENDDTIRRVSVDVGGQRSEDRTGLGMHQDRNRRRVPQQTMDRGRPIDIGEHRDRAGRQGLPGELGAMRRRPGQRRENITGNRFLGTQCHPAHTDVGKRRSRNRNRTHSRRQDRQCQTGRGSGPQRTAHRHSSPVRRVSGRLLTLPSTHAGVGQAASSVSGGPGSGESGTFSRCSSQPARLWNSGAAE